MLPNEIENIIHEYRVAFELVDTQISDAIHAFYTIENRCSKLLEEAEKMELCSYHVDNLQKSMTRTVQEAARIVSDILENEEIHMVQTEMLCALNNEIVYDIFNVLLHPFYLTHNF